RLLAIEVAGRAVEAALADGDGCRVRQQRVEASEVEIIVPGIERGDELRVDAQAHLHAGVPARPLEQSLPGGGPDRRDDQGLDAGRPGAREDRFAILV